MSKKLYLLPLFLLGFFLFATTSCLDSKNDEVKIDEEWKALNESRFAKMASDPSFNALSAQSSDLNLKVYWQKSTEIMDPDPDNSVRITVQGKPEFTDTVIVRYEGWYINTPGEKVIFDSTENPSLLSKINYSYGLIPSVDPNYNKVKFAVNGVIAGWTTLLEDMLVGDERIVCIPQQLGYGSSANTYAPKLLNGQYGPTFTIIPGYTTLWFRIKLYKIIPMRGLN